MDLLQTLPKWSWYRKHLWLYSATKALLNSFLLSGVFGRLGTYFIKMNVLCVFYSYKDLWVHGLSSCSMDCKSRHASLQLARWAGWSLRGSGTLLKSWNGWAEPWGRDSPATPHFQPMLQPSEPSVGLGLPPTLGVRLSEVVEHEASFGTSNFLTIFALLLTKYPWELSESQSNF